MKFNFLKSKRFYKRLVISTLIIPLVLLTSTILIVYLKQDAIVKELIETLNQDFHGSIRIKGSHIAPFANFPYISIDLEEIEIFEGKNFTKEERLLKIKDTYIGFNLFHIIKGKFDVRSIKLSNGAINLIQRKDGSLNLTNALSPIKEIESIEEEFHLNIRSLTLKDIDVSKLNEENNMKFDIFINKAKTAFKTNQSHTRIDLDTKFQLSIKTNGDTTFIKNKHFELDTELNFNAINNKLTIAPTEISLEKATFGIEGSVDLLKDVYLDLKFHGNKPDFNLFLAMAPEELAPTLQQFENKGTIYFEASVKGKSVNGHQPAITAEFGCKNGFFKNTTSGKKLDGIGFKGSFTNGEKRNIETMHFQLENFTAKPEAGVFKGKLDVINFLAPEIDMQLISDFNLNFLVRFFNMEELKGLAGKVKLTMNFHDIIDLNSPEKAIEKLNESYFTELQIEHLSFKNKDLPFPIRDVNVDIAVKGHKVQIRNFDLKTLKSDIQLSGSISDLPAILHHTDQPIVSDLLIKSKHLDLRELSGGSEIDNTGIDEQIDNLSLKLKFLSSAKAITESTNLPIGEFFIEDLYAKLKHYPHTLHDFHADVYIDDHNFRVMDFSGEIDQSDFHFSGKLKNYNLWFEEKMQGDTKVEFDLTSKHLHFDNIFAYGGENFVPEDYRHEEIKNLNLHGVVELHFKDGLHSSDFQLSRFNGKMKVHPITFEQFSGRVHLEKEQLSVKQFKGKLGHSDLTIDFDYFLGKGQHTIPNKISVKSERLDFDELMNYQSTASVGSQDEIDHDAVFSIYDFDFPLMDVHLDIHHLNYHRYLLNNFKAHFHSDPSHILTVNKMAFDAAGGHFDISGYLSGKDKEHIYFKPDIKVRNVDLDKFMVKFENFGQDHLISENLHGKFSGHITGKIHLHADLVPKLDDSDMKINMTIIDGKLENYSPLLALSSYFQNKNLTSVRFDTLINTFIYKNNHLTIPDMTINSTIGFLAISGEQNLDGQMEMKYLIGVPWNLISEVSFGKLFRSRKKDKQIEDEIQYRQENSKFVYVLVTGDVENFKMELTRKKKGI